MGLLPRTTETDDDDSITQIGLRTCDGNPNCFSTTGDALLRDWQTRGVDFLIKEWMPLEGIGGGGGVCVMQVLGRVIRGYEPGQNGIDGGGFQIVKETDSYLYIQFESLKKGYINDMELATVASRGKSVLVRSASRTGQTDFGANAIRFNAVAVVLRKEVWSIDPITVKSHPDYWVTSDEAREATFDKDRRNL